MNFEHIMIDLETLSSKKDALILSLGAVRFDLDTFEVAPKGSNQEFYETIDLKDAQSYGLRIDVDTLRWWLEQSKDAQKVFHERGKLMQEVFADFNRFVRQTDPAQTVLWGNGATFDNVVLRNAYEACGMQYPVMYKNDECYRTIRKRFAHLNIEVEQRGTAHNALDDARNQAEKLVKIFKVLKQPLTPERALDIVKFYVDVPDKTHDDLLTALQTNGEGLSL